MGSGGSARTSGRACTGPAAATAATGRACGTSPANSTPSSPMAIRAAPRWSPSARATSDSSRKAAAPGIDLSGWPEVLLATVVAAGPYAGEWRDRAPRDCPPGSRVPVPRTEGGSPAMTARTYRKPGWWQRTIANRLAPRFAPRRVATLSVRGRRSGQWRTVPVVVLEHEGQRYLLTPFGDTDWSRNLRAAGGGRLRQVARSEGQLRAAWGPSRPSHLPHRPAAVTGTATARLVAKGHMQDFRQAA
jgi:deazaflavin-dependent oxidoreductase (nitroreductase family)